MRYAIALLALWPGIAAAQDLVVDTTTTTVSSNQTYANVTVRNNGTLVVNAILTVTGSMTVETTGRVTHDQGQLGMRIDVTGTLDVQPGGTVDLNGKGLLAEQTFDPVTQSVIAAPTDYAGGSHGGRGGNGAATYGDGRNPVYLGGGGGNGNCGAVGGSGGGKIVVNAGTLRVDGVLRSNGVNGSGGCSLSGGGAGGSILINATTVTGAGIVSATGGSSTSGGGGGGRIAMFVTSYDFTGSFGAAGGTGSPAGGLGSVYILVGGQDLKVVNGYATIDGGDSYRSVAITAGGVLDLNGNAAVTQQVALPLGATVQLRADNAMAALSLPTRFAGKLVVAVPFTWAQAMDIDGEVVVNAPLSVTADLTVESSGRMTTDPLITGASIDVTGTAWIKLGGSIHVSGKGLTSGRGINPITLQEESNVASYAGGSYGGRGGGSSNPVYGDPRDPIYLGAGGGPGNCSAVGGNGGGRIVVNATTLRVEGSIRANGEAGSGGCTPSGGGAGGAIVIDVGTLTGNGIIEANGGATSTGGGGGGRIAISYTTFSYTGAINALGGNGSPSGSQGSLYLLSTANDLRVPNGVTTIGDADSYNSITLTAGSVLVFTGAPSVTQQIAFPAGTAIVFNDADALQNTTLPSQFAGSLTVNVPFSWDQDMTVDGTLIVNAPLAVSGNLTVNAGGTITHDARDTNDANASVTVGNRLWVKASGFVDVSAKGYPATIGIDLLTQLPTANVGSYAGGSYGGSGGGSGSNPVYGDPRDPTFFGAGGGNGNCSAIGGRGGGKFRAAATTIQIDGVVRANGGAGSGGCTLSGGGAGGAIRFDAGTLTGNGLLEAKGGNTSTGGGGGGRIALYFDSNTFTGSLTAAGGSGSPSGSVGSVYQESTGGTLYVRGGTAIIDGSDSYAAVALGDGGVLRIRGPAQVTQAIDVVTGSTVVLESSAALDNLSLVPAIDGTLQIAADTSFPSDLTLAGTLIVDRTLTVPNLTTVIGATITHSTGITTMHLSVPGTLALVAGSTMDVRGRGYTPGPWAGFGNRGATVDPLTFTLVAGSDTYNGGSHASLGGQNNTGVPLAAVYDDVNDPIYLGGGGGGGNCSGSGGYGGGLFRATIGSFVQSGTLYADGGTGSSGCTVGGGGAGGTIRLVLGTWSGNGVLTARGGNSSTGGGAGGIVHISYVQKTYTGTLSVAGGAGSPDGAVGFFTEVTVAAPPTITSTPLTAATVGQLYRYQATASGSLPISWELVSGPAGAAISSSTGELTWTPGTTAPGSFTIRASNSHGNDEQVFNVTVTSVPVFVSTPALAATVGQPYQYDGDGRAEATGTAPIVYAVTIGPVELTIDRTSGAVSWTPVGAGAVNIALTATNAQGSATQNFTVVVEPPAGVAPSFTSTPALIATADQPYHYDADDTVQASGTAPIVFSKGAGSPTDLVINSSTGRVTWTPTGAGEFGVTLVAANSFGEDSQSFTVTVAAAGVAPVITSTPALNATVDQPYQYDADERVEATGSAPIAFSRRSGPAALTIDTDSGLVAWTPVSAGTFHVELVATNDLGEDAQAFDVVVQPATGAIPIITSIAATAATVGLAYHYDANDRIEASGDAPISFSVVSGPIDLTVDASTGTVHWTPGSEGNVDVTLRASNAYGSDEQAFVVAVAPDASGAPHIEHSASLVAAVGRFYVYDEDGRASASGATPIAWSKVSGPVEFRIEPANGVVTWLPTAAGTVDVTLAASNSEGRDEYTLSIVVSAEAGPDPTAVATVSPSEGDAPLQVTADASQSYAAPGRSITFYRWNFGDGTPLGYGAAVTHTYQTPGSYVARLRVVDSVGAFADKAIAVTVLDQGQRPPTARILVTQVEGAESLTVDFACNCSPGTAAIEAYLWDFGDGTRSEAPQVTHTFSAGGYEVRLTVVDAAGLTATDSVVIRVTGAGNQPPFLVAQGLPLAGPAPLSVDFLATYGDGDGSVVAVAWDFGDGEGSDQDEVRHTFQMAGTFHVVVKATDDQGLTASAGLDIEVSDAMGGHPPQILSIPATRVDAETAYHYDSDDTPAARGDRPLNWSLGKKVGDQTVGAPDGMTIEAETGRLSWTPTREQIGTIAVVLVARNAAGAVAQEWEIEVGGEPIVAKPEGCGCHSDGSDRGPAASLIAIAAVVGLVVRRRRRNGC